MEATDSILDIYTEFGRERVFGSVKLRINRLALKVKIDDVAIKMVIRGMLETHYFSDAPPGQRAGLKDETIKATIDLREAISKEFKRTRLFGAVVLNIKKIRVKIHTGRIVLIRLSGVLFEPNKSRVKLDEKYRRSRNGLRLLPTGKKD